MVDFLTVSLEDQEIIDFLRRNLRLKLICKEILFQKIVKQVAQERSLDVKAEEIQAEIDRIRYENRFDHPSQLLAWLTEQMTTLNDLEQRISEQLLTQKLARYLFANKVQNIFEQYRSDFEQILFYKIVVPYENLAYELFYQIEEEEMSFFEAAHVYNTNESCRLCCGYEGKQQRRELRPEIAEILFNAQTGEVIGPLKTSDNTYELFWVDELVSPELNSVLFEDILNQMFQEWMESRLNSYLSNSTSTQDNESSS
ncbi:MAG: hypothetical protein Kow00121_01250 [Elainellaceae cyanobacterium]